jgi:hypothetical protein
VEVAEVEVDIEAEDGAKDREVAGGAEEADVVADAGNDFVVTLRSPPGSKRTITDTLRRVYVNIKCTMYWYPKLARNTRLEPRYPLSASHSPRLGPDNELT